MCWFTEWLRRLFVGRTVYQFQASDCVIQFLSGEYTPTFGNSNILGYLRLADISGNFYMRAVLRAATTDLELSLDPLDGFVMSDGDIDVGTNWFVNIGQDYSTGPVSKGGDIHLWTIEGGSRRRYLYVCPGAGSASAYRPFLKLNDACLVISDMVPVYNPLSFMIPSGHAALYWDDTAKALKVKESDGTIYTWTKDA